MTRSKIKVYTHKTFLKIFSVVHENKVKNPLEIGTNILNDLQFQHIYG